MRIGSLRNRLALYVGGIVLGAIAVVYFGIAPQLEGRIRDQTLDRIAADAERYAPQLREVLGTTTPGPEVAARVRRASADTTSEVIVLGTLRGAEDQVFLLADSTADGGIELEDVQRLADQALATRRTATGT